MYASFCFHEAKITSSLGIHFVQHVCRSRQSNDLITCHFIDIYFLNYDQLLLLHVCSHMQRSWNIHAISFMFFKGQTPKLFSQQHCLLMRKVLIVILCTT